MLVSKSTTLDSANYILFCRYNFKVIGIYARFNAAQMINVKTIRYIALIKFVTKPMAIRIALRSKLSVALTY